MGRTKAPPAEDMVEFAVDGNTVKVMSRPAADDRLSRLFEPAANSAWSKGSSATDDDLTDVVRGPLAAPKTRRRLHVVAAAPAPARETAGAAIGAALPVEAVACSLPGTPDGLVLQMDERGNGHLYAIGDDRVRLGSDGMWWIVSRLIEALEDPQTVSMWPRFLTVSGTLGGPAVQASLQYSETCVCLVWRRLQSGVVGELVAWQELSHDRAQGWLNMLRPMLLDLERRRVHRQRLLPARTAARWAHALERWSA
jgi:hypothetical protein